MQLLILAAGMGRRLDPLTRSTPKCLVRVNGEAILPQALGQFTALGLERIVIVIGHLGDAVRQALGSDFQGVPIHYLDNPVYDQTNNIYSLWLARDCCDRETILMEADVLLTVRLAELIYRAPHGNVALVDSFKSNMDGTLVELDDNMQICSMTPGAEQGEDFDYAGKYKTVNAYRFQADYLQEKFMPALEHYMRVHGKDRYYELVISALIAERGSGITALEVGDEKWIEVDDFVDLERAEVLFSTPDQVYDKVDGLYGGFWRYDFKDYSYLHNLYFPPPGMLSELRRNMQRLICTYPSGSREILNYLQNWVGVPATQLVIGNGVSEIIAMIKRRLVRRMAIPVPTFNEYYDGLADDQLHFYLSEKDEFVINPTAFADEVEASGANVAVLVNPDLPSGRLLDKADIAALLMRLAHLELIVVDESFIEFSDAGDNNSLLADLNEYPNLLVIRSLSKDLGIPGLRLGYAASSNTSLIELLRKELPIWNINGIAEFFLAILPKYRRQFVDSCGDVIADRNSFYQRLCKLPGVEVYPSQANYFLIRLPPECSSGELRKRMFTEGNILVKDCSNKAGLEPGRYIRIAVRRADDNRKFIEVFSEALTYYRRQAQGTR
ncbi:MAG: aminotransferase class I/II-fold pyridoxal phosphate-dependent enzyme [Pseudomonadota bacterium]